ncbi:hypothetical protein NGB25_12130 [Staphylococcus saprophyticus]|uniref:hypothetical protein n=1 Tax=Staphylococcus saprophyticus TaxID=29385 RepID=UPI002DB61CCD|nr:hypothetical protein [Staphylococcus saprophyticus]MEB7677850.1 hypothetical protein [Staphylococcus saprophyticus]
MIKKINTKTHTFLIEEVESVGNDDAYYGRSLLLSIYIAINLPKKTKAGQYYYSNQSNRIALKDNVLSVEEPTEKEIKFYNLLKDKKSLNYSKKLTTQYDISKYLRCYFVDGKDIQNDNPKCLLYYDSSIL